MLTEVYLLFAQSPVVGISFNNHSLEFSTHRTTPPGCILPESEQYTRQEQGLRAEGVP
jgi:hypothetical protein